MIVEKLSSSILKGFSFTRVSLLLVPPCPPPIPRPLILLIRVQAPAKWEAGAAAEQPNKTAFQVEYYEWKYLPLFHRRKSIAIIFTLRKHWWYFAMAFLLHFALCSCQFLRNSAFSIRVRIRALTHHFIVRWNPLSTRAYSPYFRQYMYYIYSRCLPAARLYLFAITIFSGDVINATVF